MRYEAMVLLVVMGMGLAGAAHGQAGGSGSHAASMGRGAVQLAGRTQILKDAALPGKWMVESHENTRAELKGEDGGVRVNILQADADRWHVQMYEVASGLKPGKKYELSVALRASAARTVVFTVQEVGGSYRALLPQTKITIGTEWRTYKIRFATPDPVPAQVRVPVLHIGEVGSVWVRPPVLNEVND